jgi:hypothetical protein
VDAAAGEGVEINGHGGDEGLAFAGGHSGFAKWSGFGVRAGGQFFGRAAVLRLAFRTLGIQDRALPSSWRGSELLAAWVSRLFDFIVLSATAVYPLNN